MSTKGIVILFRYNRQGELLDDKILIFDIAGEVLSALIFAEHPEDPMKVNLPIILVVF